MSEDVKPSVFTAAIILLIHVPAADCRIVFILFFYYFLHDSLIVAIVLALRPLVLGGGNTHFIGGVLVGLGKRYTHANRFFNYFATIVF